MLRAVIAVTLLLAGIALASADESSAAPPPTYLQFVGWIVRSPARAGDVRAFERYLQREGVSGIFPTFHILRSESSWQSCHGEPFALAPQDEWPHIVATLRFIRDHVIPATGPLEVLSAYREPELNACAGGASGSAHKAFWAFDMQPTTAIGRDALIEKLCRIHAQDGGGANIGLGIYSGVRFHIDSMSFRRWGPDGHGATSPCNAVAY